MKLRSDLARYKTRPSQWSHEMKLACAKTFGSQVIFWFKPPTLCENVVL